MLLRPALSTCSSRSASKGDGPREGGREHLENSVVVAEISRYGASTPAVTPSMRIAIEDLHLDSLDVVHAGDDTWHLAKNIRAVALSRILEDVEPLS